jgi:hypothetical protein
LQEVEDVEGCLMKVKVGEQRGSFQGHEDGGHGLKVSHQTFPRGCGVGTDVCHHLIGGQQGGVLM